MIRILLERVAQIQNNVTSITQKTFDREQHEKLLEILEKLG